MILQKINDHIRRTSAESIAYFKSFGYFLFIAYVGFWIFNILFVNPHGYENVFLRLSIIILGILLIFSAVWIPKFYKYYHFVWYFTLVYTLPFFFTFMWLQNPDDVTRGIAGMIFSLIALSIFVDRWSYVALAFLGIFGGFGAFFCVNSTIVFPANAFELGFAYLEVIAFFLFFGSKKDKLYQEKIEALKMFGGAIAHEMRTPLASIHLTAKYLKNELPEVLNSAKIATNQMDSEKLQIIEKAPERLIKTVYKAQNAIDMLLSKVKMPPKKENFEFVSTFSCINKVLQQYPFHENEEKLVSVKHPIDFVFYGTETLFCHILMNLLKNALELIRAEAKGNIEIWSERSGTTNKLFFKDTAKGISKRTLPFIFDRFFTTNPYGTGIGLAFCKQTMKGFGGDITCESVEGAYTTFCLIFPKVES